MAFSSRYINVSVDSYKEGKRIIDSLYRAGYYATEENYQDRLDQLEEDTFPNDWSFDFQESDDVPTCTLGKAVQALDWVGKRKIFVIIEKQMTKDEFLRNIRQRPNRGKRNTDSYSRKNRAVL